MTRQRGAMVVDSDNLSGIFINATGQKNPVQEGFDGFAGDAGAIAFRPRRDQVERGHEFTRHLNRQDPATVEPPGAS